MFGTSHSPTFAEDDDGVAKENSMDVVPVTPRPSASVAEIPGASAQPMRINEIGSFNPSIAMKGLKTGAMSRELVDKTARIDGAGTSNFKTHQQRRRSQCLYSVSLSGCLVLYV